jgi:hypothetical protein
MNRMRSPYERDVCLMAVFRVNRARARHLVLTFHLVSYTSFIQLFHSTHHSMPQRSSKLLNFAQGITHRHRQDSTSFDPLSHPHRAQSPTGSGNYPDSNDTHGGPEMQVSYNDRDPVLAPPIMPYGRSDSPLGSRHSSQTSLSKDGPNSLSVNYVPAKFTKLHQPGSWQGRNQKKQGGGRDAFATDASRMGMVGTVDDDEGTVFALGKGGVKQKKQPKLRWNRFKWVLMLANILVRPFRY